MIYRVFLLVVSRYATLSQAIVATKKACKRLVKMHATAAFGGSRVNQ